MSPNEASPPRSFRSPNSIVSRSPKIFFRRHQEPVCRLLRPWINQSTSLPMVQVHSRARASARCRRALFFVTAFKKASRCVINYVGSCLILKRRALPGYNFVSACCILLVCFILRSSQVYSVSFTELLIMCWKYCKGSSQTF